MFDLAEQPADLRAALGRAARAADTLPEAALLVYFAAPSRHAGSATTGGRHPPRGRSRPTRRPAT